MSRPAAAKSPEASAAVSALPSCRDLRASSSRRASAAGAKGSGSSRRKAAVSRSCSASWPEHLAQEARAEAHAQAQRPGPALRQPGPGVAEAGAEVHAGEPQAAVEE
eukprot:3735073-Lingulodinium_polyedra.AAC.1